MGREVEEATRQENSIGETLMDFLRQQAEVARKARKGYDEAGLLDVEADDAYGQLTRVELGNTERAITKLLANHAGERRLAAIISIAVKHAVGVL